MITDISFPERDAVACFVAESAALARSMPSQDARVFLRGLLISVRGDDDAFDALRVAYSHLTQSDDQLELISRSPAQ